MQSCALRASCVSQPRCTAQQRARQTRGSRILCAADPKEEPSTSPSGCKMCGVPLRDVPRGCNQEGRVAGGIGAVVGFDWWPVKAYRPCPKAAKAGVLYSRKGQITDEMLFGRAKDRQ